MAIEVSFGWDNHERALFPNQHRSINLYNDKPCIITGRNGSGKTLSIKVLNKIFSVISSTKEYIYIDSKRFFEDIGLSWAKIKLEESYIRGGYRTVESTRHDFQKLSIPYALDLFRTGGIESDNENEYIEYKIHADVIIEKMAQVPEIRVDFYLVYEYSSSNCFVTLNDEGECEDEEYVEIESEFYSKNPFQTIYYENLRVLNTEELFDGIDKDLLLNEIRTAIKLTEDDIGGETSNYDGFDFDEYEEMPEEGDFLFAINKNSNDKPFFKVPIVKYLEEKRIAPKIDDEFGIFFAELVNIRSKLKPIIDEHNIILEDEYTSVYSNWSDASELDCDVLCVGGPPDDQKEADDLYDYINGLDCDESVSVIPALWATNYKLFSDIGFESEFDYDSNRYYLTIEERRQFFTDVRGVFGKISEWPQRNRFKTLSERLDKLIETDLLTKCLRKTSVSIPGDSDINFQYLRDFIHYLSYRMYVTSYFRKYLPLLHLFEGFFEEDSENSTKSYAKFLKDINNQDIIPSGYQNLLSMTMSIAEYSDANDIVVFLDEPEISLHISWQIKLVAFLYGLLDCKPYVNSPFTKITRYRNKFLIIATHSPDIVSGLLENTVDYSSNIDL